MKRAFLTGITGMDSSHLAELLLGKSYEVYGLIRRNSNESFWRIENIKNELTLINGDLTSGESLIRALEIAQPDEVYNLGAQSFVKYSFDDPIATCNATAMGALRLIEAVRLVCPKARVYQASSSEQFGKVLETPQKETTPFYPRSPYGVSKVFAHYIMKNYREAYNMNISCGICFNHESERRGIEFVSRKITDGVARIRLGLQDKVKLGNLDAKRDFGYAPDYVYGMWQMLQSDPDDYVMATGKTYSIREFFEEAIKQAYLPGTIEDYYEPDPQFLRPAEVDYLRGDATKIKEKLGWEAKTTFSEMVKKMVDADYNRLIKLK
jgi:GDPmannose 4,6-dehydratase